MKLERKLKKLGFTKINEIDGKTVRMIAENVTDNITKAFPYIEEEYNNILAKLLNCKMYKTTITKNMPKINYMYENQSIYFDSEIDLNNISEQMIHECIHYIQDKRNKKGKLKKLGLCNFTDLSINGLGLNEGTVQYISSKCMKNEVKITQKYNIRVKTISSNYYPLLTSLIEQIIYLIGEEEIIKATLCIDTEFEDLFLNTYEENTKKIINILDKIINIENKEKEIQMYYFEAQNMIFETYFNKICPKIETENEVEFYLDKVEKYKDIIGKKIDKNYEEEDLFEIATKSIIEKLDNRLYKINKEKSKNALLIIAGNKITKLFKKLVAHFT